MTVRRHSIPLVGDNPSQDPPKKASAKDLLKSLASGGKKTVKKSNNRPVMNLSPEIQKKFSKFVILKTLADIFDSSRDLHKDQFRGDVFDSYVETMWKNKSQPTNPALEGHLTTGELDSTGVYIVQERYTVNIPDLSAEDDPAEKLVEVLVDLGLNESNASSLVENEVDVTPFVGIRKFNELTNGRMEGKDWIAATDAEKVAAEKIMNFVQGVESEPLTDEEKDLVLEIKPQFTVKKGFLERAAGYVRTLEQLKAVFSVIVPVHYPKVAKFGISDNPEVRNQRLVREAALELGVELED